MNPAELGTSRRSRRPRLVREYGALVTGLAVAVIGLAACGGSSNPKSASKSASAAVPPGQGGASATTTSGKATSTDAPSHTSTSTSTATGGTSAATGGTSTAASGGTSTVASGGTSTAASGGTSTSTKRQARTHPKNGNPTHTKKATPNPYTSLPVVTTITQSYLPPGYNGPSPTSCLTAAGLTRARQGREPGVWEGNVAGSLDTDENAIVFLSGPSQDANAAANYADSLKSVELAASGGTWVASASSRSGLQTQVDSVANCMAQ